MPKFPFKNVHFYHYQRYLSRRTPCKLKHKSEKKETRVKIDIAWASREVIFFTELENYVFPFRSTVWSIFSCRFIYICVLIVKKPSMVRIHGTTEEDIKT
ncbi:CLUMA_CG021075, isoform A [Clunio marinus]|uniref:CLUMA_CG021075, isoform A n=1 Tax=Clunio marinus TaxID=568069 RepID=A0A1J1JA39_9DIPT|nr:CLUMA_CG021075, isoform A [Clunio marinus]